MSAFTAALCVIRAQAEESQRQSVTLAIYDATRLADRVKSIELLATVAAVFRGWNRLVSSTLPGAMPPHSSAS